MIRQMATQSVFISFLLISPAAVPSQAAESVALKDDVEAVDKLAAHATSLKRDADGYVVEANFRGTQVDDQGLVPLAGLRRLRAVLLNDTRVTDSGMVALGKIATLRNLDLRGCKIGNAGIAHLSDLQDLRGLKLSGQNGATMVDDQGLVALGKLKSLKALALDFLWVSGKFHVFLVL